MCGSTVSRRTMKTAAVWTCFVLLFTTSVQGLGGPRVEVTPKQPMAVRIGETLSIMCRVGQAIKLCRYETPDGLSILLQPGQPSEDGIEYLGDGLHTGQCGIRIAKVSEKNHDGVFKCGLTAVDSRSEVSGTATIIVAKPPQQPELNLSDGAIGRNKYRAGEKLEISCSAPGGRPPANVSLYLDDQPLKNDHFVPIYDPNFRDRLVAIENVSYALEWKDNGKPVRCVVDHIALDSPKEIKRPLNVYYQPQGPLTREHFGYVIGRPGIINMTVDANPRPMFIWKVNGEAINELSPDASGRLEPSTARDLGNGKWQVELKIETIQKSDIEKEYVLQARNDEGATEYQIKLFTSAEPEGVELDAGYIIGIVVGVLVLLLLVFLIVFARATGRWCFAGGSAARNIGESDIADPAASISLLRFRKPKNDDTNNTSDTESAGRYSRTEVDSSSRRPRRPRYMIREFFNCNKDKVSSADTDTMRTVVTVDDEKVPEASEHPVEGGLVYAELDLAQNEQAKAPPRRVSEDKTEYAEILYTKPEGEENANPDNKK